ncbi:MAG: PilZ domain-containing protein [Deltaproteobacteria bacterium]|nr:PilZ domain-containing protein [Deltaproteobacteria bacterium]
MNPKVTRQHPRITAPVKIFDLSTTPPSKMYSKNIGLGGLMLQTNHRKPVGSLFDIVIEHKGMRSEVRCRVTHLQADGFGVSFVEPTINFIEFLQKIVDDLLGWRILGERRQNMRLPIDARIVWTYNGVQQENRLINLSHNGGLVESSQCPPLNSEIFVYLPGYTYATSNIHPSEARGCIAQVMHTAYDRFGVQFINPSAEFRMAVEEFVRLMRLRQQSNT